MQEIARAIFLFSLRLLDSQSWLFLAPLAVFFIFRYREIIGYLKENSAGRLLLSYFLAVFSIRCLVFMVGYPYQGRYFYPLALISIFPISAGLIIIAKYAEKFKIRNSFAWLSLIIIIASSAKTLNPPLQKKWLKEIPDTIKANLPKDGRKAALITAIEDTRLPYYSKADYHLIMPITLNLFMEANIVAVDKDLEILEHIKQGAQHFIDINGGRSQSRLLITQDAPKKFKSLSFLWAISPQDATITVAFKRDDKSEFETPETTRSDHQQIIFKEEILAKQFLITMDFGSDARWSLKNIEGYSFDSCQVFSTKYREGKTKWTPEDFGYGFQAIFHAAKIWGGRNVFILFNASRKEIEKACNERGLSPNLKFLGEFKTHKQQTLSLYQGRD